jgi:hypothetical protein
MMNSQSTRMLTTGAHLAAIIGALGSAGSAGAAEITVTLARFPGPVAESGDFPGHTGYAGWPGIYPAPRFGAGERFAGQAVSIEGGFEVVTGTPTGPLQVPAMANGVTLFQDELQGQTGACESPCTGEGAVTFSFDRPVATIGLDIRKGNGGNVTLQFFEEEGVAFDPVVLTSVGADQSHTFAAEPGHRIVGVALTNVDSQGVAYDDLRLPIPADINGDGGVDVSDLLLVLAAWGACPAPCPPPCPADVNGDCQVSVGDLLTVLADWG